MSSWCEIMSLKSLTYFASIFSSYNCERFASIQQVFVLCCSCCPVAKSCLTLCGPMDQSMPGCIQWPLYLLEFAQSHVRWAGDAISPSHPVLLPSLCAFSLSRYKVLFLMSQLLASSGLSIGASKPVLSMNCCVWFPLVLAGLISLLSKRLLCLLQHHNFKASIFQCSAFFMIQLSHSYTTTGKTIALAV